jgi:Lon protease-like protein
MDANYFPLFPLRVVLLPDEFLPLHIFEERYKLMIGQCREEDRPFGVVLADEKGVRKIGCSARIVKVMEEYPDGRMNILTQGEDRFRILHTYDDRPYLTADIEFVDDRPEDPPPAILMKKILAFLPEHRKDAGPISDDIRNDPKRLSFWAGASLRPELEDKQLLLESESTSERLTELIRIIEETRKKEKRMDRLRQLSPKNGHP